MKNKTTKWFVPYRYISPADLEHFFESMAQQGWNVEPFGTKGNFRLSFYKTQPINYSFTADLNPFPNKEYFAIYESFGWERIGNFSSVYLWRQAYIDKKPTAFSDSNSITKRNQKYLRTYELLGAFLIFMIALLTVLFLFAPKSKNAYLGYFITIGLLIALIGLLLFLYRIVYKNRNK